MAKRKRESKTLNKMEQRLAGMRAIDPNLDLGGGTSVAAIAAQCTDLQGKVDGYNQTLSQSDAALNAVHAAEKQMGDQYHQVLIKVAAKYGLDSDEYEKVGGKRKSARKRRKRKSKKAALPPATTKPA